MTSFLAVLRSKSSEDGMKFWYETVTASQNSLTPRIDATFDRRKWLSNNHSRYVEIQKTKNNG